jgi:DNA-binding transcriptional MerR regulator
MFDIDGLAKQVLCEGNILPDNFTSQEEVFEIRDRREDNLVFSDSTNLLDHETTAILKKLAKTPNKLYRIGEVVTLLNIKDSTLRYWETKFSDFIKPTKNKGMQRLYKVKDIEYLLKIKKLLTVEKLNIEGVRKNLKNNKSYNLIPSVSIEFLHIIKEEIDDLKTRLVENLESISRLESGK